MKTTVIGAYPKITDQHEGQELRRALHRLDRGEIGDHELDAVIDATTDRAIREIEGAGIDVPNYGLIRWEDPLSPFVQVWRNVSRDALERFFDNNTYFRVPAVSGPIEVAGTATVRDWTYARGRATRRLKAAVCGPLTFARLADDKHYRQRRQLALAAAAAIRQEIRALEAAGCDLIDVEEPALARWPDDIGLTAEVYGELTGGVKAELALQLSLFPADPLIGQLADLPFGQIGIDLRSRQTQALERLGDLRAIVVLGVVDARNTKLESPDDIARVFAAAAQRLSPDRVWLAPTTSLEYLPHDVALAKLQVLVAGARAALTAGGAR